ncbi:hypothetical protein [Hymenobacter negativus]|uniref:DUF937 domain-containing protein n=1 Tax=Hymenobacter negativus TaxID=2795026 RepID=A0ABS3QBG0_9BACT|nr:hypothetical protein [Hymenobacter negativus]MBO2008451.1 hypothetical protein [Hymenobacter negativus]
MDNPQNQPGPMPGDDIRVQNAGTNTGSTGLGNDATVSGATSRKGTSARGAQQASGATDAQANSQADQATAGGQPESNTNSQEGTLLDTALNSGKQWIEDSGVLNSVNQLPQSIKDLGNRALDKVNGLSTTQKVVGGAILAAGIGWLATRKGKSSSSSSESSPYNYGRQRDAGSYGRRSYGYQAPDASTSRRPEAGSGRSDSGAPYGNGGSRYGSSASYGTDASSAKSSAGNTGIKSGSGRSDSSYGGASASTDHGAQHSSNSFRSKDDGFRSIE